MDCRMYWKEDYSGGSSDICFCYSETCRLKKSCRRHVSGWFFNKTREKYKDAWFYSVADFSKEEK